MKLYTRKIDFCEACPVCGMDGNGTRYLCQHPELTNGHWYSGRFLNWLHYEEPCIEIPDWCPLPNCDILEEREFEI